MQQQMSSLSLPQISMQESLTYALGHLMYNLAKANAAREESKTQKQEDERKQRETDGAHRGYDALRP